MRGRALLAPLLILTFMMGAAAEGQLAVRFEPAESELGTIAADQQIAYSVTLSNPTETSVTVQLMATCGCIADGAGSYALAPGESRTLEMVFDSSGMHPGLFEKYFIVRLSGGASGKAYYFVTGSVE